MLDAEQQSIPVLHTHSSRWLARGKRYALGGLGIRTPANPFYAELS